MSRYFLSHRRNIFDEKLPLIDEWAVAYRSLQEDIDLFAWKVSPVAVWLM